ncbi:MAG: oligoendopeptidase F, partial [Oscillospiraceae bacterium]|nr:oligoendopeptidase F [Oscillospiraceae bacterium]
ADLKFPEVVGSDGEKTLLSNGRFITTQMSGDRKLRREAFEAFYARYKEFINTSAALYDGQVKQQIFFARARKYPSTFDAAVSAVNVSPAVCDNLIESVHRNLDKMHRYVRLRKKMLGVDELHMYDVYAPMVSDYSVSVTYEEAQADVLEALRPLGEEYVSVVRQAFADRWTDVVENEGKRGGAYSADVYGVHPYMLLNWSGRLTDVFTLIHEMGHSMHTWYSDHAQTFFNSKYKIFVAEVASTTNEILLLEYLLDKAASEAERAYLINHYLESFKGTMFRQTMFEEFERKTNAMAEQGIPLTADALSGTYLELNKQYFGEDMVSDPLIAYEWARIPHFYYNFYVYQYATSFAASVAIAHRILEEGQPMVDRYLSFLRSGCTEDPVSLLKKAGVDLTTGKPVDEALAVFEKAIIEMEAMVG